MLRFAIPVLGALILQAAYGAVDLLIVGKFGNASSISAVGTGSSFMQMATFIITSLAMGSTVIIGHHIGEQKPKEAGNAVGTTIILFLIIAVVMTFVLEFAAGGIARLLQTPAESFDKTILYIRICSAGIVIIIAYNVISGVLRGVGNANLPLLFVGIACVVNILGDLLLVGAFHMDVAGAAIATVFAQFVSVVCSVAVLRKQNMPIEFSREQCRIYKDELKKILNVGVPIALQETTVQISFLVVNSVINQMGLMPSSGYGIAQKIVSFIMLVPSSVMQSVSAFVAQNIGAGKKERAWKGFYTAIITGCSVGIVLSAKNNSLFFTITYTYSLIVTWITGNDFPFIRKSVFRRYFIIHFINCFNIAIIRRMIIQLLSGQIHIFLLLICFSYFHPMAMSKVIFFFF